MSHSTEYTFAVRAYTDIQNGPLSDSVMAKTSETPDSPPRNMLVSVKYDHLICHMESTVNSAATNYELFISHSTDLSVFKISRETTIYYYIYETIC